MISERFFRKTSPMHIVAV